MLTTHVPLLSSTITDLGILVQMRIWIQTTCDAVFERGSYLLPGSESGEFWQAYAFEHDLLWPHWLTKPPLPSDYSLRMEELCVQMFGSI